MKSSFVLPAFCAAAIHAAFLLGFESPSIPRSVSLPEDDDPIIPVMVIPLIPLDEPDVVDVVSSDDPARDPLDVTDIAPDPTQADLPDRPDPGMIPQAQPENIVLSPDGIVQQAQHYAIGDGEFLSGVRQRLGDVFSSGALDRIPAARLQVPPRYPDAMRRVGAEASVVVTFIVGVDGQVVDARADDKVAREFAEAAEQAVRRWRFEPGTRHGQPVQFRMSIPLVFSINE